MNASKTPESAPEADERGAPGFAGLARESLQAVRSYAGDVTELAALEVQLASTTGIRMAVVGVAIIAVALAAWIMLEIAGVFWLAAIGWPVAAVLAVVAGVNAAAAWLLFVYLRRLSRRLTFPATRQLLFDKESDGQSEETHSPATTNDRQVTPAGRAA